MNYAPVVDEIFSQIRGVNFAVHLWDGKKLKYGTGPEKDFTLILEDEHTAKRLLSQGALGFGESYMDGRLRLEGDLEAYLKLRHQFKAIKPSVRLATASFLASRSMLKETKDQISYHYDIGNDFFKLILDHKTMSYSCGRYLTGKESLDSSQQNKIQMVCDWLNVPLGAKILDLGCGWGGFATFAAKKYQWQITSYTLSQQQFAYCKKRLAAESLSKYIKLQYRDMLLDLPKQQFDAIVMLESIEHVGKARLESFVKQLYERLRPGGVLYIQTTGRYQPKPPDAWTLKYVFPGGYLPSQQQLVSAASAAGFQLRKFVDDTPDYILTLTEWIRRLESNRRVIEDMFDPTVYRLWELWMHGAKVAFEVHSMGLFRIELRKPE